MASGQAAGAPDALLLARGLVGVRVVPAVVLEDVALKDGQVLGVAGVASVVLGLANHEGVEAAVTLAKIQCHDVGHEQHRQNQASLEHKKMSSLVNHTSQGPDRGQKCLSRKETLQRLGGEARSRCTERPERD